MNIFKKIYQYLFVPSVEEVKEECKTIYTMEGVKEDFPPEIKRRNDKQLQYSIHTDNNGVARALITTKSDVLNEEKADEIKAKRKRPYKKKSKNK